MKLSRTVTLSCLVGLMFVSAAVMANSLFNSPQKTVQQTTSSAQPTPAKAEIPLSTVEQKSQVPPPATPSTNCDTAVSTSKTTTGNATNEAKSDVSCKQQTSDTNGTSSTNIDVDTSTTQKASSGSVTNGGHSGDASSTSTTNTTIHL